MSFKNKRLSLLFISMLLLPILLLSTQIFASTVAEKYLSDSELPVGTIVMLKDGEERVVEAATSNEASRALGVVVDESNTSIIIGDEEDGSVNIAHSGQLVVIVSDIYGTIEEGDNLSISPIAGVASKAQRESTIIGQALEEFDGENAVGTASVENSDGSEEDVKLGRILVQFEVASNPAVNSDGNKLPSFIRSTTTLVAGKEVTPLRALASFMALLASLFVSAVLLYSAIRNAIISIGRNPLSKRAIYGSLVQVFLISVLILAVGVGAMYVILRL